MVGEMEIDRLVEIPIDKEDADWLNESVRLGWSGLCRVYEYSPPPSSKYSQSICSQVCVGFQNTHLTIFQVLSINLKLFDQSIPRSMVILTHLSIPGQSVLCVSWRTQNSVTRPFFQPKASLSSFSLEKKFHLNSLFGNFPCCRFFFGAWEEVSETRFVGTENSETFPKHLGENRPIHLRIRAYYGRAERSIDPFPMKMFLTDKFWQGRCIGASGTMAFCPCRRGSNPGRDLAFSVWNCCLSILTGHRALSKNVL